MQYNAKKEVRILRDQYAEEINSPKPNYEKLCQLYEEIHKNGGSISASVCPSRYMSR